MPDDALLSVLSEILAPLVEADEGELYLVTSRRDVVRGEMVRGDVVHLHLRGRFSGCPGNSLVSEGVFLPALRQVDPALGVEVSSGPLLPEGAQRIHPRG